MTTNDQDNEQEKPSSESSAEDRVAQIKKEEQEDASTYYAQGDSHDKDTTEEDFSKPVAEVDPEKEEMSLLKAVAFLGFGMAALAVVFILFFIRDLGHKVGDVDAAVQTLEQKFGPLKQEMDTQLSAVNKDMDGLKQQFGRYERQAAVMELKRALVAIQGATTNTPPEVQAQSGQVIASIQNLLNQLEGKESGASTAPPTTSAPVPEATEEAPAPETSQEETTSEAVAETEATEEAAIEETTEETSVGEIELQSETDEAGDAEDEGGDEEDDEEEEDE